MDAGEDPGRRRRRPRRSAPPRTRAGRDPGCAGSAVRRCPPDCTAAPTVAHCPGWPAPSPAGWTDRAGSDLDAFDPADTHGLEKDDGLKRIEKLGQELSELENLLTYAGTHGLLVVLQGRDASGKDGAIRKILEFSNIQQSYVQPFKVPTEEERAHDFLWRVHKAVPRRGHVTLFNRSHYEDVLAARVHKIVARGGLEGALRRTSTRSSG